MQQSFLPLEYPYDLQSNMCYSQKIFISVIADAVQCTCTPETRIFVTDYTRIATICQPRWLKRIKYALLLAEIRYPGVIQDKYSYHTDESQSLLQFLGSGKFMDMKMTYVGPFRCMGSEILT